MAKRKGSRRKGPAPWYLSTWMLALIVAGVVVGLRLSLGRPGGNEPAEPATSEPDAPPAEPTPAPPTPTPMGPGSTLALRSVEADGAGADAPLAPGADEGVLALALDPGELPRLTQGDYAAGRVTQVAEVSGTVTYRGVLRDEVVVPRVDRLACPEQPAGALILQDGRLADAVLWLEGIEGGNALGSGGALRIEECRPAPRAQLLGVGTTLLLTNGDGVEHALVAEDAGGEALFRASLPVDEETRPVTASRAGLFRVRCERHPWEEATLLVLPHPYAAVTGERGTFHLGAVPVPASGQVMLRLYHPALGTHEQVLQLEPGHPMTLEIDLTENLR